jgi:hypothetical protein
MAISFTAKVTAPPDVLVSEVGGEAVLLNLENECYFGLDEIGARMWQVLTTADSVQAAFETLLAEFDVEAEQLRGDLTALLEKLESHGLVAISRD